MQSTPGLKSKGIIGRVVSNFAWSVVSEAIGKGIFFVANIYLARTLGVDRFGLFTLAQTVIFYFWLAVDLGTNMYSIREIAKDKDRAGEIINALLTLRILAGLVVFGLYIGSLYAFGLPEENRLAFIGCGLYLITYSFYMDWALKGLEQFKYIAYGSLVSSIIFLAGIFLLVKSGRDVSTAAFVWSLSFFFGSVSLLYFAHARLGIRYRPSLNVSVLLSHVRESIFFTLSGSLMALYQYLPILILGTIYTTYEVGLFSAPYKIVITLCHAGFLIATAYYPVFSELYHTDRARFRHAQKKIMSIVLFIGLAVAVPGSIFSDLIITTSLGETYRHSALIFRLTIWLFPLYLVRHLFGTVLFSSGLQRQFFKATLFGAGAMVTVGAALTHWYGTIGASVSLLLSEFIVIVVMSLILEKAGAREGAAVTFTAGRSGPSIGGTPASAGILRETAPVSECADYDFLGTENRYWCEIPPEAAEKLIKKATENGYDTAVSECLMEYPQLTKVLTDVSRADFIFHILKPYNPASRCLDLGSGWGSISRLLARHYGEVWSVEANKERIWVQRLARERFGLDNVRLVRSSITDRLPFEDAAFDLVVLNGVLEWTPCAAPGERPEDVHLAVLREIHRVLRPGGCIYIGIENRFAVNYMFGAPDHSGLKFITLMPRLMADLYVRLAKRMGNNGRIDEWEDFRTVLYSWWGFRSIIKAAGFVDFKSYWVAPSYSYPKLSGSLDGGKSLHKALKSIETIRYNENLSAKGRFLMVFFKLGITNFLPIWLIRFISPCFQLYAFKDGAAGDLESRLFGARGFNSYYRMSGVKGKIYYFNHVKGGSVVKVSRSRDFNGALELECRLEQKYGRLQPAVSTFAGLVTAEYPVLSYRRVNTSDMGEVSKCLEWLSGFQKDTSKGGWDGAELEGFLSVPLKRLKGSVFSPMVSGKTIEDIEARIKKLSSKKMSAVSSHGDFAVGNIGFSKTDSKTYIFDWEEFAEKDDPLFDYAHFMLSISNERKVPVEELIMDGAGAGYREILDKFLQPLGFGPDDLIEYLPIMSLRLWYRSFIKMNITQAKSILRTIEKDERLFKKSVAANTCYVKMQSDGGPKT